MDATTLKHFLKVCLRITLTPAELAALMGVLDRHGDGLVDGAEFLTCFHKIVRIEHRRRREEEGMARQRKQESEERLLRRIRDKAEKVNAINVSWPSIEEVEEYATRSAVCKVSSDVAGLMSSTRSGPGLCQAEAETVRPERRTRGRVREGGRRASQRMETPVPVLCCKLGCLATAGLRDRTPRSRRRRRPVRATWCIRPTVSPARSSSTSSRRRCAARGPRLAKRARLAATGCGEYCAREQHAGVARPYAQLA